MAKRSAPDGKRPPAKRRRAARVKPMGGEAFVETSESERWLTDVDHPIGECLHRLNVAQAVQHLTQRLDMYKTEVKITDHFSLYIQNIVLTAQLLQKKRPGRRALLPDTTPQQPLSSPIKKMSIYAPGERAAQLASAPSDQEFLDAAISWIADEEEEEEKKEKAKSGTGATGGEDRYKIPIDALVYRLRHVGIQYNPKRFAAAIFRNDNLRSAALIFASGNFVSTGCARMELALWMFKETLDKIAEADYDDFEEPHPQLRNIVSSGRLPNGICTYLLAATHSDCCRRADRFPGTMIQDPSRIGKRVILVFDSGKVCHSGAHSIDEIRHDMQVIYPMLVECQRSAENEAYEKQAEALLSDGAAADDPDRHRHIYEFAARVAEDRATRRQHKRTSAPAKARRSNNNNNAASSSNTYTYYPPLELSYEED